jgi:hypothetical protein
MLYKAINENRFYTTAFPAADLPTYLLYDQYGLAGGQMLLSLADGETVLSARIDLVYNSGYQARTWNLSLDSTFPSVGSQPGDELWRLISNSYGLAEWFGFYGFPPVGREFSVSFTAVTSLGTVTDDNGGGGYQGMFLVPEPSSVILSAIGVVGLLRRRRI